MSLVQANIRAGARMHLGIPQKVCFSCYYLCTVPVPQVDDQNQIHNILWLMFYASRLGTTKDSTVITWPVSDM